MNLLDVQTLSELEGISPQAVRKKIQSGKYGTIEKVDKGRGRNGINYRIPIANLSDEVKMKYYEQLLPARREVASSVALDSIPDPKIKAMDRKMQVLEAWWEFQREAKEAGTVSGRLIDDFIFLWNHQHPQDRPVKRSTLYSWEQKARGRNKHFALVDQRGGHNKGDTVIPEKTWSKFLQLYLTEEQKSMRLCHMFVEMEASLKQMTIPSYSTFKVHVSRIPKPILVRYREGETAYKQKYLTYILRDPSHLKAGQWWVADHRRLDIQVLRRNGKLYRPWITAFMDVRCRRILAVIVSDNPNADIILLCFRKAVKRYGLPEDLYIDNGRDFCAIDMAGSSNRWKSDITPSLMRDLGINVHFTIPREPSGKSIERAFRTVKESFDRCFSSFCGGHPQERPDGLQKRLDDTNNVIKEDEMAELVEKYIEYWHNERPHSGMGMDGKSPRQVYEELANGQPKRMLTEEQLRYLLLRTERKRKVGRNGLDLFEGQYYSDDLHHMKDKYVYAKYDPEDLSQVYVYDEQMTFQCIAVRKGLAHYANDEVTKEVIRGVRSERKRAKRLDVEWKEQNMREDAEPNVIKRVLATAQQHVETSEELTPDAKVVQLMPALGKKDIKKIRKAEQELSQKEELRVMKAADESRNFTFTELMRANELIRQQLRRQQEEE